MGKTALQAVGHGDLPRTPVDNDALLTSFLRHWNRLPRIVREEAAEMIAASNLEEIEP